MDNVFIEGVGSTTFGQHSNRTAVDLAVEASLNAIEDAKSILKNWYCLSWKFCVRCAYRPGSAGRISGR